MSERTCDVCGETKPRKAFWGVNRNIVPTCNTCRSKERKRKWYYKNKKKLERQAARKAVSEAVKAAKQKAKKTNVEIAIYEIDRRLSQIDSRMREYADKIAYGAGTKRTEKALRDQERNHEYFEDVRGIIMEDASLGIDRPLEYYLSNTYLLNKHGFPVVVTDADPREDRDGNYN